MNSPKDKCPKCDSGIFEHVERARVFACGTTQEFLDNQWGSTAQSDKCKLHALRSEVEQLRTALKPFAEVAKFLDEQPASLICMADEDMAQTHFKHFRAAQAALAETKDL